MAAWLEFPTCAPSYVGGPRARPCPCNCSRFATSCSSRAFDLPGAWWADQPEVIGGRDRQAGGSWCVSDIATGVTAVVLNRPEHRIAEPGAPSRGVLPLLAVAHREHWTDFLETTGMAGFHLVLASPESLLWWSFDGQHFQRDALPADTYMFTPDGLAPAFDERLATGYAHFAGDPAGPTAQVWAQWLAVIDETVPSADPAGLLVRRPLAGDSYETVFGQFIAARPGALRLA